MYIATGTYIKNSNIISYVPPVILKQIEGSLIPVGTNYTFFIKVRGSRPLKYTWYKNNSVISVTTVPSFTINNATLNDDAYYFCEVSNNSFAVTSVTVKLNVREFVGIITQPLDVYVNPNANAFFTLSVSGSDPLTYKWYKDGEFLLLSNNNLYINNATSNNEGDYYCVISNEVNSVTTNTVSLELNRKLEILSIPPDIAINATQNINQSLTYTGTDPVTAQWKKNDINYNTPIITSGGTVPLIINNIPETDAGNYNCELTNIVGSVTSSKFIIYVRTPPFVTVQPISVTKNVNESLTLTFTVTGTQPYTFLWYKNNQPTTVVTKNLVISKLEITDAGAYKCVISNMVGTVSTNEVILTVNSEYMISKTDDYLIFKDSSYWNLDK